MGKSPGNQWMRNNRMVAVLASYTPLLIFVGLFLFAERALLSTWWAAWDESASYYSHGPLIPFIVAYLVYVNRKRLASSSIRPCFWAIPMLLASLAFYVLGAWGVSQSLSSAAFMLFIYGSILLIAGARITKILTFPVLFLISMIPTAAPLLDRLTISSQLVSATIAAKFLEWSGYAVQQVGTTIFSNELPSPLVVGVPCSGLRILISLITFTAFFVYLVRCSWIKKAVLVMCSFPLGIFINSLRITMIGYAGLWTGSSDAMHSFHDYSGYIVLVICFAMLFLIARLIGVRDFVTVLEPSQQVTETPYRPALIGGGLPGVLLLAVLGLAAWVSVYSSPIVPQTKGRLDRAAIPMQFGHWRGQELPIDELVRETLKRGDIMSVSYVNDADSGHRVDVFLTAARDPDALHDPHVCLPSHDAAISADRTIELVFTKPRHIKVAATYLTSRSVLGETMIVYFYMIGSKSIPDTNGVWQEYRNNMLMDAKSLVLNPWGRNELKKRVENRQFHWYRFSTDVWQDEEADLRGLKAFISEFVANSSDFGR